MSRLTRDEAEEYTAALGQVVAGSWRQVALGVRLGVPASLGLTTREWVEGRLGGYVKLAAAERRDAVAELTRPEDDGGMGMSQREAADVLGTSQPTVSRLARPDSNESPSEADQRQESKRDSNESDTETIQDLARQRNPEPVESPALPASRFTCVVIDPPWPMRKIERDVRPWQGVELDYPVMDLDDIAALPVGDLAAPAAHLYLWVTHRFLPAGLGLVEKWGFDYQCLMTWNKNTGMVPYSWMYDTEHVIFAARGGLRVVKRGMRLSFDEPVNGHSVKPEVFYDRVRGASPVPRLEMFARRSHAGFESWGAEAEEVARVGSR